MATDPRSRIASGVGAYIRATPAQQLPGPLRRFKKFTPKGLGAHRDALVAVLDDDAMRGLILEWLDDGPMPLPKQDAALLRAVCAREPGWEKKLETPRSLRKSSATTKASAATSEDARRARDESRRARDEARRAKEEGRKAIAAAEARIRDLEAEVRDLRARGEAARKTEATLRAEPAKVRAAADRETRRLRKDLDGLAAQSEELKKKIRELRKAHAETQVSLREETKARRQLERDLAVLKASASESRGGSSRPPPARTKKRRPLKAPKGRLEEDPQTLVEWLDAGGVHLVIDGYNVTKAEGGFGAAPLADQRDLLIGGVSKLARSQGAPATIVFDGSRIPPGAARRSRGPVDVQYSKPPEIADDHIIALLESLPPDPVILVTNDRELQQRARAVGATVVGSQQLLALIH